ncbi:ATP-binding protein [Kocuria sp. M4R2S49]|uniref:HAMP domain-containing sensor histidine kinase n=1 Tax=Kocuria rhizosphaericola TaxID=3376284 RepID=UPI0037A00B75
MKDRLPLRLKVAAAFAVATALVLTGLAFFVYYRVEATLEQQMHTSLLTQLESVAQADPSRRLEVATAVDGESFAQVLTPTGEVVASSDEISGPLLPPERMPRSLGEDVALTREVWLAAEGEREPAMLLARRDDGQVLVVGTSREDLEDALEGVLSQFLVGVPLALLLASGLGYVVAGSALRPIERMRQQAASISARNLDERLPLPAARDEIHRLGSTLNAMLERLDAALERERRFVAEAGHELRTPLALLRMEVELALSRPRSSEDLATALRSVNEEVDRLSRLCEDLLLLATSDEGRLVLRKEEFDLRELLSAVADRFATRAGAEGRAITVAGDAPLRLRADRARIDQAVSNLVDNALRHGGGDVHIGTSAEADRVVIRVTDEGEGMDTNVLGSAFEPFRRAPGARSTGARGLGLSIVRAVVEEHGGAASLTGGEDGHGTTVTMTLPTS